MASIIRHWVMGGKGSVRAQAKEPECFFYNMDEMTLSFEHVSAKKVLAKMNQPFAGKNSQRRYTFGISE